MVFRILSFDGGGVRGIVSATLLMEVERLIGQPLNEYFDLIAGTSTGSILAAGVATGRSAKEIVTLYQQKGVRIFPYNSRWSPQRLSLIAQYGPSAPKYSDKGLIDVLKEEFQYQKLSEVSNLTSAGDGERPKFEKAGLLVPAYDTMSRSPIIFKSWRRNFADVPLWEVCVCSASAPTFFPAHELQILETGTAQTADRTSVILSLDASPDNYDYNGMQIEILDGTGRGQTRKINTYFGHNRQAFIDQPWNIIPANNSVYRISTTYSVIDGGVGANNPTACAIAEALRLGYQPNELAVLSLGTGNLSREIPLKSAQEWGALQWALPILDVVFDASTDIYDYIARQVVENRYLRLQFRLDQSLTGKRLNDDIDDASSRNLSNLIEAANVYVKRPTVQSALQEFLKVN